MRFKRYFTQFLLLIILAWPSLGFGGDEAFEKFKPQMIYLGAPSLVKKLERAEAFANRMIAKYRPAVKARVPGAFGSKENPIPFVHVGDVPEQLQWILVHLKQADLELMPIFIKDIEIVDEMSRERQLDPEHTYLLHYGEGRSSRRHEALIEAIDKTWVRANILRRWIMGMPNGFTLWPEVEERKPKRKVLDAKLATVAAGLAGLTTTVSLYVNELATGQEARIIPAVAFISTWVWVNTYHQAWMTKFLGQSQWVKRDKNNMPVIKAGTTISMGRDIFISLLVNGIFWAAAFDLHSLTTFAFWKLSAINTALSLASSTPLTNWIFEKRPDITDDGEFKRDATKGQWEAKHWMMADIGANLAWRLSKNLHALGIPVMDPLYKAFALVYGIMTIGDSRFSIYDSFKKGVRWIRRENVEYCDSLVAPKKILLQEEDPPKSD